MINTKNPYEVLSTALVIIVSAGYFLWKVYLSPKSELDALSRSAERLGFVSLQERLDAIPDDLKRHPSVLQLDTFGLVAVWERSIHSTQSILIWKSHDDSPGYREAQRRVLAICFSADLGCGRSEFRLEPEYGFFDEQKKEGSKNSYKVYPADDIVCQLFQKPQIAKFFEREAGWYLQYSEKWLVLHKHFENELRDVDFRKFIDQSIELYGALKSA